MDNCVELPLDKRVGFKGGRDSARLACSDSSWPLCVACLPPWDRAGLLRNEGLRSLQSAKVGQRVLYDQPYPEV